MVNIPEKATQPTMYFVGVTTGQSSIMKVFPEWSKALGLGACIKGIDIAIHADPQDYRDVVSFMKNDPLSLGALVTTHKIDLYNAARDMFEYCDPYAEMFKEMSSISKRGAELRGHAKDPITCGQALEEFIPANYWAEHPEAGVMIMGAGGAAISMCSYFMRDEFKGNYPKYIYVANRSLPRLKELEEINKKLNPGCVDCQYFLTPEPGQNDEVLAKMGEGSLIVNATGLGKDRPGSPLTDDAIFPKNAIVWEINYRGELDFMHQAEKQQKEQNLKIEDGWMYFIYGWTAVISEVFDIKIEGDTLRKCADIAAKFNNR